MLKNRKLSWPQTVLASVVIISFAATYTLGDPESRDAIEKGILALWGLFSTFMEPLFGKKKTEDE